MIRVATYARYSSDQQRESSIADQQRECREYVKRRGKGWVIEQDLPTPQFQARRSIVRASRL
jgi:DNA invertase Pin-like site-specific DNA recombinase